LRAAALKRGVLKALDLRSLAPTVKAFKAGFKQGKVEGDVWQQGGVLIVLPSGDIAWQHASERPGDNASVTAILGALVRV